MKRWIKHTLSMCMLALCFLQVISCNGKNEKSEVVDIHNSELSLDWVGSYNGVLPCGDCDGIETTLTLNGDMTYEHKTKYQGKSEKVFIESGKFKWDDTGSHVALNVEGEWSENHQYKVIENGLLKLDNQGNIIEGALSEKYKLLKSDDQMITLNPGEYIYHVGSSKVPCEGVGAQSCLMIQKGNEYYPDSFQMFYSNIEGFNFKDGYQYKLIVKEEELDQNTLPADASGIKYTLVRILNQKLDDKFRLHDIWALESIDSRKVNASDFQKFPDLEINITENRIMGNDGCNTFNGTLVKVHGAEIQFSPLAMTKMACPNMGLSSKITQHLSDVKRYKVEALRLMLFDAEGNEILRYKKVD